jgi:lysophospholipase L1-like esterase
VRRFAFHALLLFVAFSATSCIERHVRAWPPDSSSSPTQAAPAPAPTPRPPVGENLTWIPATDPKFTVSGLAFYAEHPGKWQRFPDRAEGKVPASVWRLSQMPSGGRIRFRSDTTAVGLRAVYPALPQMRNMHNFGQAGIDVYLDGEYKATLAPRNDLEVAAVLFEGIEKREREITIYLPLYIGVDLREIGLDPDASIEPPTPFALEKPIVYYGTSITQGGCASRPGMSYQAILSRRMNTDFVNFGFSGAGRGEPAVAALVAECDASAFVMDMAQNNPSPEDLEERFGPFLDVLRAAHPDTPILCTTPIYMATELPGSGLEANLPGMRDVIRKAVRARQEAGDANLHLIEGYELLGPEQGDGFVDGVHPNDLGFYWMSNGLEPRLRKLLNL